MSIEGTLVAEAAKFTVTRAALPWLIAACVMVLCATGLAGMYGGYEIANGRNAADKIAMAEASTAALAAMQGRYQQAQDRGNEISGAFMTRLDGMKIENKTFYNETKTETEKLIYTDCKLPDSGADLLKRHVDSTNARLLGTSKATK